MPDLSPFFVNPWLLAALGAAALPAIIEWLFRRRKKRVELPTIRFLLNNQEQKKIRRQDRLLLLLRTLAIVLLVAGIARPLLQQGWVGGKRNRDVVVVLDGTASMHQQVDVTTAFGLAQKKAAAVIRSLPQGTTVSVLALGDHVTQVVTRETDLHTAAAAVETLRPGSGAAPISAALDAVKDLLQGGNGDQSGGDDSSGDQADSPAADDEPRETELYVFSDFQKYTWLRESSQAAHVSQTLTELRKRCETYLVDVGGNGGFNYIVTQLRPVEYVLSEGLPVRFQASVECRGQPPKDARVPVSFLVDGVKKDVQEITPGSEPAALEFSYRFPDAGQYLVEVVVEGDAHRVDNRRLYLCQVPKDVRVLILDETAEAPAPKTTYLARAIRPPSHPGMEKVSHFDVKTISPARLAFENLAEYAVVVLAASSQLNDAIAGQLEGYVNDGGSLWLFMGEEANLYDYNKVLYKDGRGLLPCKLAAVAGGAAAEAKEPVFPRYGDTSHPALVQLSRLAGSPDAAFLRYVTLEFDQAAADRARTVVALSNGQPAIVEKPFGRGKVLLANTTAGPDWSYLPALVEFPVLVQELLRYLVGSPDAEVNLEVGQRFVQPVFVSAQHLLLRYPDGSKTRLTPQSRPGGDGLFQVSFEDTVQPGQYRIEAIEEVIPRRRFVVNQGAEEGDLSRLARADVADALPGGGYSWIGPQTPLDDFAAQLHTVLELAPWLIGTLAGVLALESLLAWRFGRRRGEVTS